MAAPTTQQAGIDFLLSAGGTQIGGRRDATLNMALGQIDTTTADSNRWRTLIAAIRQWSIDFSGLYLEGTTPAARSGYGASLGVWDSTLATPAYVNLPVVRSLSLSLSMDVIETTNQDSANARTILPSTRSGSIGVEVDYQDPAGDNDPLDILLSAQENGDKADVKLGFGGEGSNLTVDTLPTDISLGTPYDDKAVIPITLEMAGEPTETFTNPDPGLQALINAFFADAPTSVAALIDTGVTGATQYSGSSYPTSLKITIPFDGEMDVSGTLDGSGELTRGLTA